MLTQMDYVDGIMSGMPKLFHWPFVERAPPKYNGLTEKMVKHSDLCGMSSVNAIQETNYA